VTSVRAISGTGEQRCWYEQQAVPGSGNPNVGAAIIGGIIGGVLGHQVGSGRGNDAATAAGAVAGAAIGANAGGGRPPHELARRIGKDRSLGEFDLLVEAVIERALDGTDPRLRALGGLAVVLAAVGAHELAVLFGAGLLSVATAPSPPPSPPRGAHSTPGEAPRLASLAPLSGAAVATGAAKAASLSSIFWVFCKTGSVLFGSGYVLVAFLRSDLVERLHWLTEAQLIDAVAVGQITPGPVFTTATFVGYVLAGPAGAIAATLGIFLPAFVFVALSGPLVPRLRASARAGAFLDGVNVASLALMVVVTAQLARAAVVDLPALGLALGAAGVLIRFKKVNATWLVLGGALAGLVTHWARHAR